MPRTTRAIVAKRTRMPTRGVKRTRTGSLVPYSSTLYRRRRYTGSRYGYGVAGSNRFVRRSAGRDVPLYLPPRPRRFAEVHAYPSGDSGVLDPVTFALTGSITHLNPIARGDSLEEREGDRCYMMRLILRGTVEATTGAGLSSSPRQAGVLMVVYDRQPLGALPVITDILDTATYNSLQRLDTRDRFSIMYRQMIALEAPLLYNGTTLVNNVSSDSIRTIDLNIPIYRAAVYTTTQTSGAIANVKTGALYAIFLSQLDQATFNTLVARLNFRISFSDSN